MGQGSNPTMHRYEPAADYIRRCKSFDTDYGNSADPRSAGLASVQSPFGASPRSRAGAYADYSYPSGMSYPEPPVEPTLVFSPHNMGGGSDSVM